MNVETEIARTLKANVEASKIVADARDMRERLAREIPGRSPWDLKFTSGGLVDIEFIAQTLVLCSAQGGADVLDPNTIDTLEKLRAASVLTGNDAAVLLDAARLQQALTQVLQLCGRPLEHQLGQV